MAVGSDLPPAYHTLNESSVTNNSANTAPEVVVSSFGNEHNCGNGAEHLVESSFEDKDTRIGFIQKVLAITLLQVLVMTIAMVIFLTNGYYLYRYYYSDTRINSIVVSALAYLVTYGLLIYCKDARWQTPYNYMFLAAYPVTFGCLIGISSYPYVLVPILMAWVYFSVVIFTLLLYSIMAFQTKIDFTVRIGFYITLGVIVALYALTVPFIWVSAFDVLYCTLVVFLLCAYILNDLQAMVSKDYRFVVTPADYVMGALIIHIDYRYIFMKFYSSVKSTFK